MFKKMVAKYKIFVFTDLYFRLDNTGAWRFLFFLYFSITKRCRDLYDISNKSIFYFLSMQPFHFVKKLKAKKQ